MKVRLIHTKKKKISVLQQEIPNTNLSILDYVLSTDSETQLLIEEFENSKDQNRIIELSSILDEKNAYKDEWKASYILSGLGFKKDDQSKKINELSGGWRNRVGLQLLYIVILTYFFLMNQPII